MKEIVNLDFVFIWLTLLMASLDIEPMLKITALVTGILVGIANLIKFVFWISDRLKGKKNED